MENVEFKVPEDLKRCIEFHGHLCPGLMYGYLVAKQSAALLNLSRSKDEEIVAVCENDSCAIDALQIILGTTAGKGNLILKDYGKNAYTIFNRHSQRAIRFSRKSAYKYDGDHKEEFERLDAAVSAGKATEKERRRHKMLKALELLSKPFDAVFSMAEINFAEPPYAPLARSEPCAECGEMTMFTKMVTAKDGRYFCLPCSEKISI